MTVEQIIGLIIVGLVMFIGFAGTFLPGIPGAPLIFIAAVGHRLYFGDQSASYFVLSILLVLTLLSIAIDFLASMFGAKKLGATWKGVTGAIVGAIVGLFFNLPGIILGPFIGAFLFEMAGGRKWEDSARAGVGALLGIVLGGIGRIACCVVMIALFFYSAFVNASRPPLPQTEPVIAFVSGIF